MTIGNIPRDQGSVVEGKTYWRLSVGPGATQDRFFDQGWRGFEFVIYRPFQFQREGSTRSTRFRIAFAYWLPFYPL